MTPRQKIEKAIEQAAETIAGTEWGTDGLVAARHLARSLVDAVVEEADTAIRSSRQIPTGAGVSQTVATMAMVEEEILHNACLRVRALKSRPTETKKP